MRNVRPIVIKIGETFVHPEALGRVLAEVGASETASSKFLGTHGTDGQTLIEFAGRICYESYEPGLNPNVTRIREDPADYFRTIEPSDGSSRCGRIPPPKSKFGWSSIKLRRFAFGTTRTSTATLSQRTSRTERNRTVPNSAPRSDAPENELTKDARRCDR